MKENPSAAELHRLLATLCGNDSPVILQLYREGKIDIWSALDLRARELNANMEFLKILMRRIVIT